MKKRLSFLLIGTILCYLLCAQQGSTVTIAGTIRSIEKDELLAQATVRIKGSLRGVLSDDSGRFSIRVPTLPVILEITHTSFQRQEVAVTNPAQVTVVMIPNYYVQEIVVVGENLVPVPNRKAGTTIRKLAWGEIRDAVGPSIPEVIANTPGVDNTRSSITFQTIGIRGFNGSGSYRINQFLDGMNNQAPGLNFPVGNLFGLSELDADNIEILHGASSALYGSGGLNGTILLNSKNPFNSVGLSVLLKQGVMHTDKRQRNISPYYDWSVRWAKTLNDKLAVKFNAQFIKANDWQADDTRNLERTSIISKLKSGDRTSDPNYDGVNVYGDEVNADMRIVAQSVVSQVTLVFTEEFRRNVGRDPTPAEIDQFLSTHPQYSAFYLGLKLNKIPNQRVSRTGYHEAALVDYNAYSLKFSGGIYYKLNDNTEFSLVGYFGNGTTVYTGNDRYSLKGVKMGQYKAELKNKSWLLRIYTTQENAGEAYNTTALASYINEAWKSSYDWFPQYVGNYAGAALMGAPDAQAHAFARNMADEGRWMPGSSSFKSKFDQLRKTPIKDGGALFLDRTDLWNYEGLYNFKDKIKFADILVGANYKLYLLNSKGTLFADTAGRIKIPEYGGFIQVQKSLFGNILILTASGRYDKSKNFEGRFTPRLTANVRIANDHHLRFSYQTAYRFPANEDQYIDLKTGVTHLIGALPEFWRRYNFYENPVYTSTSIAKYRISTNPSDLEPGKLESLNPETVKSIEGGYKALINKRLLVDVYGYFSKYENFFGRVAVGQPQSPSTRDMDLLSSLSTNSFSYRQNLADKVNAYGFGLAVEYKTTKNYMLNFSITSDRLSDVSEDFVSFFNTPAWRFNVGVGNQHIWKGLGFRLNYQWQDKLKWESPFGTGDIPAFGTLNAQISYEINKKSQIKLGASNLLNKYYSSAFGNPQIGGLYYLSVGYNIF